MRDFERVHPRPELKASIMHSLHYIYAFMSNFMVFHDGLSAFSSNIDFQALMLYIFLNGIIVRLTNKVWKGF